MTEALLASYTEIASRLTVPSAEYGIVSARAGNRMVKVFEATNDSVYAVLARAEDQFSDRDMVWDDGRRSTYATVFSRAARLATALRDQHDIRVGSLVGIAMRNRTEWFETFIAIQKLGAVAVLFNSRSSPEEFAAAAEHVSCSVIVADDERAARLREASVATSVIGVEAYEALIAGAQGDVTPLKVEGDAPAAILFTSGTTGRPKGAVLTQRNLTHMAKNLSFMTTVNIELAARQYGVEPSVLRQLKPVTSALIVFPLFHISGLTAFFVTIGEGGLLNTIRRWDPARILPLIAENSITMLSGPPLIMGDLLSQPGAVEKMGTINNIGIGGQATPRALVDQLTTALPMASQSVGWGMTETTGSITAAAGNVYAARPSCCGLHSPLVELRVRDDEGNDLPHGVAGELWVRSVLVMQGYWNDPEATDAAFDGDWLRTGDVGMLDPQGFVELVDRKKDMVISAGENIYCAEVERVIGADPDVQEVAVFGIPHARLGEIAVAAVNLHPGSLRTDEQIKANARAALADYKVPTAVIFGLGAFPRNATGKVQKASLREIYLSSMEALA